MRPDAEAVAEFNELYPDHDISEAVRICDDCFEVAKARIGALVTDLLRQVQ